MSFDAVREALLADARSDAAALVAEAERAAGVRVAAAAAGAERVVEQARAEGEREAGERFERQLARARREARSLVLAARRQAAEELRHRSRAAVRELRTGPGGAALVAALSSAARSQLGPDAVVTVDPDGEPGVVARAGSRAVDYRLAAVADRVVDSLGSDVEELWS